MTIIDVFNSVADITDPNEKLQCLNYQYLKDGQRAAIAQAAKDILGVDLGANPTPRHLYDLQVRRGFRENLLGLFGLGKVSAYRKAIAPNLPNDGALLAFSKLQRYLTHESPVQDRATLESLRENLWVYNPRLYQQKGSIFSRIAAIFSRSTASFLADDEFATLALNVHSTLHDGLYHLQHPIAGYQTPERQVAECRTLTEDLDKNNPIRLAFDAVDQKLPPDKVLEQFKANLQKALTPAPHNPVLQQPIDNFLKEQDFFVGITKLREWCLSKASEGKKGRMLGAEDMTPVWFELMKYHQGNADFVYTLLTTALDPRDQFLESVTYTRRALIGSLNVAE